MADEEPKDESGQADSTDGGAEPGKQADDGGPDPYDGLSENEAAIARQNDAWINSLTPAERYELRQRAQAHRDQELAGKVEPKVRDAPKPAVDDDDEATVVQRLERRVAELDNKLTAKEEAEKQKESTATLNRQVEKALRAAGADDDVIEHWVPQFLGHCLKYRPDNVDASAKRWVKKQDELAAARQEKLHKRKIKEQEMRGEGSGGGTAPGKKEEYKAGDLSSGAVAEGVKKAFAAAGAK
jgi:hypothetical protein